jgi:hypothetical protein
MRNKSHYETGDAARSTWADRDKRAGQCGRRGDRSCGAAYLMAEDAGTSRTQSPSPLRRNRHDAVGSKGPPRSGNGNRGASSPLPHGRLPHRDTRAGRPDRRRCTMVLDRTCRSLSWARCTAHRRHPPRVRVARRPRLKWSGSTAGPFVPRLTAASVRPSAQDATIEEPGRIRIATPNSRR